MGDDGDGPALMPHLHEVLAARVAEWRREGYPHLGHPAIAELLEYQLEEDGSPRFLRLPQIRALETYWYLRLVEGTPRVIDLYQRFFPERTQFLEAMGLNQGPLRDIVIDSDGVEGLLERIATDDTLVRDFRLEAARA